jgi:lipooligosaccharide transport system permease protein
MFVFSGVFFGVDRFPVFVQPIAWILPMTHVIEVVRPLTAGQPLSLAAGLLHTGYVAALGAVAFTLAYRRLRIRLFD